ncbi:hypothetical protein M413DRAFT_446745 [Hebeloma cylindrosporum]|uniref:Uncharacterized protein n=1 Tax=Hebeloma cylindrosporum TaxID=76867 RepID=A0A0C3BT19_HEBCY|nr:hypothetical protein M413DRAFT_446745 [Hebeloma cylindrosporum h7]
MPWYVSLINRLLSQLISVIFTLRTFEPLCDRRRNRLRLVSASLFGWWLVRDAGFGYSRLV